MQITLVIPAITSGGAERVLAIMANYWVAKDWGITLLTFDDGSTPPFYTLEPDIQQISLGLIEDSHNLFSAIRNNIKRVKVLRSAIIQSHPDVVISFMNTTNVLTLLAARNLGIPVLVAEHIHPVMYPIGFAWELLRRWTYPQASQVIAVTERILSYFSPAVQARGGVIPNPALPVTSSEQLLPPLLVKPSLIAMGRLDPQKGFDLLLQAFSQLKDRSPEWTLGILGEGTLRSELEAQRDRLGLTNRVYFLGAVPNPYDFLRQADIFVMSSRFEGFPNALCEAMACGLAVISTDCLSGPREIIREGIDGLLIPSEDVSALAMAMERLMLNEAERKQLASRAPDVTERFSLEKVMGLWEAAIARAVRTNSEQLLSSYQFQTEGGEKSI